MGITNVPRNTKQGPLNVSRETIPKFQQGGGLFATTPGMSIDNITTPTFNLNLAPQGLSDPRQPIVIPAEQDTVFTPQVSPSPGLSLVDPATILPSLLPSESLGDMEPMPVASPDRMYGTGGVNVMNLTSVPADPIASAAATYGGSVSDPEFFRNVKGNQRTFDNAMDTFADQLSKAQAMNVLYGGAGSSFESGRNEYTESGQYDRDREARQAAFDEMRQREYMEKYGVPKPKLTPIETARALADLQARIGFGGAMAPANNPTITIPERVEPTTRQLPFDLISGYNRRISPEEAYTIVPGPADPGGDFLPINPQGIVGLGGRGVNVAKKAMGGGIMSLTPNY